MKAMNPKAKKITKIVVDVIFWIFLVFSLGLTILAFTAQSSPSGIPTVGNKAYLTVATDSMDAEGGFKVGDLIVIEVIPEVKSSKPQETIKAKKEALEAIEVGQSITFREQITEGGTTYTVLNTHKVVSITPDEEHPEDILYATFTTHGINDAGKEGVFEETLGGDVIGVWTGKRVAGLGKFITFLQPGKGKEHLGFVFCIILPLAGFFAYEVAVLAINVKKMKGESDKKTITKAEEELIKQRAIEEFLQKQEAEKKASEKDTSEK